MESLEKYKSNVLVASSFFARKEHFHAKNSAISLLCPLIIVLGLDTTYPNNR